MKEIIKRLVDMSETFANRMKEAYNETYGDEELAIEFEKEVQRRRAKNKAEFIVNGVKFITMKEESSNIKLPFYAKIQEAERLFEMAEAKGDLDELNKLKEENDG